jgi:micrococcal nuclease
MSDKPEWIVMNRNNSIKNLLVLLPTIAVVLSASSCESKREVMCLRVIDGDTIVVEGDERVRYIGIDTPELASGNSAGEFLALEAKAFNRKWVEGKMVVLEFDRQKRDRFGRLLAYVYIGETMVNEELVRKGFAREKAYPPNIKYQRLFETVEKEARSRRIGIWDRGEGRP